MFLIFLLPCSDPQRRSLWLCGHPLRCVLRYITLLGRFVLLLLHDVKFMEIGKDVLWYLYFCCSAARTTFPYDIFLWSQTLSLLCHLLLCFYICISLGFASTVSCLLEIHPECVAMTEGNGALPLHDAVQNKRLAERYVLRWLCYVVLWHPVCCICSEFNTSWTIANLLRLINYLSHSNNDYTVSQDVLKMIEALLTAHPAAVQSRDDFGALPLHKAAKCGNLEVVQVIYEAYPKVSVVCCA